MLYLDSAQVSAQTVLQTIAIGEGQGVNPAPLLQKYGLGGLRRHEWCQLQIRLDLLRDMGGDSREENLVLLGQKAAEFLRFPLEVNTIAKAFLRLNDVYQAQHQGAVGQYEVQAIGRHDLRLLAQTPYPCEFQYGVCVGLAKRFLPPHAELTVQCHRLPATAAGYQQCVYEVSWQSTRAWEAHLPQMDWVGSN
ncbi:MAG: hypothetical protein OT477_17450 [Chloroflexi bacterium]|nr:hypothetical protein [Chloroflexota bacterium]